MPDMRRQIFESSKTVSRKAASRNASREASRAASVAGSVPNSPKSSRNASRNPSDEEDAGSLSDDTAMSIGSFIDVNSDEDNPTWTQEVVDTIHEILDRKRSSVHSRSQAMATFGRLTKYHYAEEQIRPYVSELLIAFAKSVESESNQEAILALRSIELLAITSNNNTIFPEMEPLLTRTVRDHDYNSVKSVAIQCLGACTMFGGAGEEGILDQMSFFLDIVSSDGQSIGAPDDPMSVTAALQIWGFLATDLEDLEGESPEAVQVFLDQLDSSDSGVQIAAGENIALLYEKSFTPQEEDESYSESDEDQHNEDPTLPKLIKRYDVHHQKYEIERQLKSLATVHGKHIGKKDKKSLHSNFASILTTVQNPRRGPRYNMAIDQDTNRQYGSTLTVKIGKSGFMSIDRWWKLMRLNSLRRILEGGFVEHYYMGNRAVLDNLPVLMRMSEASSRPSVKQAAKMRNKSRRWAAPDSDSD